MRVLKRVADTLWRLRARLAWNRRWGNPSYVPAWFIDGPRYPTREAVADGWLKRGSSVLELGCGRGQEAAWLAGEGFRVLGVDLSPYAIELAQKDYGEVPTLSFRALDVTVPSSLPPFDVIVDAGCLHCIPPALLPECAANLRSWSRPGTQLLLMMHTRDASPHERTSMVESLLTPAFTITSVRESFDPKRDHGRPRMVFRLVRAETN